MEEPKLSGSQDRGLGDEHARYKRTRGGDDGGGRDGKCAKKGYDEGDTYNYERGLRRRSASPRDEARDTGYRSRERYRRSGSDYVSQSKSKSKSNDSSRRERRDPSYPSHTAEYTPSTSSTRHKHHSHHHHHHHHRHRQPSIHSSRTPDELPFSARPLVRSDLDAFTPLFAQYLEVQKNKDMAAMDEREIRGRWKSFVGKWNRGDLAEGWYRPETLDEARDSGAGAGVNIRAHATPQENRIERTSPPPPNTSPHSQNRVREGGDPAPPAKPGSSPPSNSDSDSDFYGPTLPPGSAAAAVANAKHGPGIPSLQDLSLRRESAAEERQRSIADLRLSRKLDRAEQRARLEDAAPRAQAGTRERALEKHREAADAMRAFRDRSPGGGGGAEVGEAELMGGGGDGDAGGIGEYRRMKAETERRKTEREVRREEEARARECEMEERRREYRRREEGVMEGLKRIARERFGGMYCSLTDYLQSRLAILETQQIITRNDENIEQTEHGSATKLIATVDGYVSDGDHQLHEQIDDRDSFSDASIFNLRGITFGTPATRTHNKETRDGVTPRANRKKLGTSRVLACPFFKHDPEKYQDDRHCACASWETVSRVKEHVLRRHVPSGNRCLRRREIFGSTPKLRYAIEPCEMRAEDLEDISGVQIEELRSKKKSPGQGVMSEETKWKGMYKILFPNDDVTMVSPYYDSCRPRRENLLPVFDKHMRLELDGIPLNGSFDQNLRDNIKSRARDALQRAIQELEGSSNAPDPPISIPPETQNGHALETPGLGDISSVDTFQAHDGLDNLVDPNFQDDGGFFSNAVYMTNFDNTVNFNDCSMPNDISFNTWAVIVRQGLTGRYYSLDY
ncbi:hypothetical protein F4781DRAFT_431212 [Annulohypoxylon bovei var. microspora]|nr:hypothetical protein F4781DRAFT_431212 [Annulohypoxylon bovei var. microspora]